MAFSRPYDPPIPISDVTGLQTALDSKADSSHTQAISTVTGLQAALDAKVNTSAVGTAASRNVPASGNASSAEVVLGSDTRLGGGAAYENVWASDTVEAFTSGTYKAILTTSSLAVGCYEVTAIINTRRATAATVGTRWLTGTASLAGASGDALGHAMLEGSTITQITLSATSPWTTSQAARFSSADGATHVWRLAIEVTSAGTVSLQMYLNATGNVTIEKGSIVTFRKVS